MSVKTKISDTFKTIFPSNRIEFLLFTFFLSFYGAFASYIAINYTIIFDNRIPWDAYFSFDNRAIVMTGGGFERHPFSNYFFDVLRNFALWFSGGKMNVNFRLVLVWSSVFTISLTLIQIFKYLKNIIRLPIYISIILLIFFGLFSTNILLSFTPETYTYTLLFLGLFNYYSALTLKKDKKISGTALVLATISIGGMTITNAMKVFIPLIFEKKWYKNYKTILNIILRAGIATSVFILLFLNRIHFDYQKIFTKAEEQYNKFSQPKAIPIWDMIFSWFFGGNILFSNFEIRDYHNTKGFHYKALFMDVFSSWTPYIFIGIILILVTWSYIKNFKNKLVQILMLSFLIDIIIHCILKFGLHTSYIYGGHFVFVYPLLIGWLVFSYKNSPKILTFILTMVSIIIVYIGVNNFIRLNEFIVFLDKYYR